jgi:hypothetical protein
MRFLLLAERLSVLLVHEGWASMRLDEKVDVCLSESDAAPPMDARELAFTRQEVDLLPGYLKQFADLGCPEEADPERVQCRH